ncbi:putative Multidrug resistance pump [Tripterygium wilfordii]|uniref:Putative Multidrug resistance pump n=1 Tax=Tripterygium wilfordii TaxID=458696 RepID=A0A7J7DS61_TRIWF|nr:putative Multidrug resistance pump [Tripterygium wilfordii]
MDDERLLGSASKDKRHGLKEDIWLEQKKIWRVGFPAMLARVTQYGMFVVTQAFVGHTGQVNLAAYSLVQILLVQLGNGILLGMSSATETLCGQAFGAKQYHVMGIYLQRSLIINLFAATILLPVFIFSSSIFKLIGEEDATADVAGYISLWFIPILYFMAIAVTIQKYLQCQLKNMIVGWLSAASFVIHVFLSWIFLSKLNLGIPGAMAAMIISTWVVVIGEFVYIFGGWCPKTWEGFTFAAFSDLVPVLKLSISSGIMVCIEVWYDAVLVLLAGYLKNATIAISAFSICLNIIIWEFMVCISFLAASSVRVSNELGKGDAKAAKFSIKVILTTSMSVGVFFWALCIAFGSKIAFLFTNDKTVAEYVSSLSVLLAFSVLFNSSQTVFSGMYIQLCCFCKLHLKQHLLAQKSFLH